MSGFQWSVPPQSSVEPQCLEGRLINEVLTHIDNGKTKSIVSLREIIDANNLGSQFLQNIQKADSSLITIDATVREEFITKCDDGFYAKYDLYHENNSPDIQFDRDAFNDLDSKFGPRTSISVKTRHGRTGMYEFTTKQNLLTNTEKQKDFNDYQTLNPEKKLISYVTKDDIDNKIKLFNPDFTPGTKITVRKEIADAVTNCYEKLQSIQNPETEDINKSDYLKFPYYFVFYSVAMGHVMIIIKIENSYYTLGFAFPEDNPSAFADSLHLWFKDGGIFSPDPLFKLKTITYNDPIRSPNRLLDFGILKQSHIDKLNNEYLNDIKNIFCHYTETINENPDGTLNTENYSKIVPIDIVLLPRNIKYSSFGKTIIPGRNVNQKNCASFAADIFSDRIACRCPSIFSTPSKLVNNNPENCSNLWFVNVQNICQQIYMLIFKRTMPISFNQFNTVTNYIVDKKGGKKKSRKTMKRKYKKNKKYKKSRKQKKIK